MIKKLLAATVLAVTLTGGMATGVTAATAQEALQQRQAQFQENKAKYQETKEQIQENREVRTAERCSLATSRIDLWTSRYSNNKSRFVKVVEQAQETTDQVVARAKANGKNTAELEAAVTEFRRLSDIALADYDKLMSDLNNTKQYACGESEGAFAEAMNVARQQSMTTRQHSLDARLYYQNTVRPAAKALLNQ